MKKRFILSFLVVVLFSACQHDVFLPMPNINTEGGRADPTDTEWQAPRELTATQGAKRVINLKWKAVNDAVRYNIYRAESEFADFKQVGETKGRECEFEVKAEPGFDMYYRVTAVDGSGKESSMSNIERATTLSKPSINSIECQADAADSAVYVSWYMNNADAYLDSVYYNIICLDEKNKEIQRQISKGSNTTVLFTGLNPNTNYFFKVEAYNSENEFEESDIVDAATARRLRPDPATDLTLTQGLSKDSISLSFVLPNFVDTMLGKNEYEPVPLYFKIYRRVYKEGENTEPFKLIKDDFGVNKVDGVIDYTKVKFGETAEDYTPGNVVTFVDNSKELKRGEKYEYRVQSFAYTKRVVSSTESVAQTKQPGWLLPESSFDVQNFSYVKDESGTKTGAVLNFKFAMETYGVPYKYKIVEIKRDIKDEATIEEKDLIELDSVSGINSYVKEFKDLKAETGYYKYKIVILAPDETELDSYEAVGESLVTASEIPKIGNITITSGYADKVELKWQEDTAYTYTLKYWDDGVAGEPIVIGKPVASGEKIYTDTTVTPGVVRTYQLVVNNGQFDVPSKIMEATVPMKPELSSNYAYDKISVVVNNGEASNKANYDVTATFEDSSLNSAYELKLIDSSADVTAPATTLATLVFDYEIVKKSSGAEGAVPSDVIDAAVAGAKVSVSVTEKRPLNIRTYVNEVEANGETGAAFAEVPPFTDVPGDEQLLSNKITTAYVGPALLNQDASQGTNADNITVTWDKVLGADSYVVFRDRYHLGRSGKKDDLELQNSISDKYIITLNEDGTVTVKCDDAELEASELSKYVSAVYNADTGKFTLTDKYRAKTDTDTGNQWRTGQAEITWGAPNKYTVVPVLSVADGDNSSKDKDIVSIDKLNIENVKNVLGGTKGFGWNVMATKGTYSSSTSTEKVNDAIEVKWTEPYFGKNDRRYAIFRKEAFNTSEWKKLTVTTSAGASYIDSNNIEQGKVYEYAIVEKDSGAKSPDVNFITKQSLGENGTILNNSKGFILPKPEISAVSREDLSVRDAKPELKYCEEVVFITDVNINDMINGYVIQVRNNNIDNQWHDIKDVPITKDNKNNDTFIEIVDNLDLLKVLRDYKHYYRIRAYTIVNGEKIYSKPDDKEYDAENNPYVEWGCRQISNEEFTRAANLLITYGFHYLWVEKPENPVSTISKTTKGGMWKTDTFNFNGYQRSIKTKDGIYTPFLNIKGKLNADYYGGYNPYQLNSGKINFVCEDSLIKELYNGSIEYSNNGKMKVTYGNETKEYQYYEPNGTYCPLALGKAKGTSGVGDLPAAGDYRGYKHETGDWQ